MTAGWLRFGNRPKPYRVKDFARREKYRDDYLRLAGFLVADLDFSSVFDVGCANGFLLQGLLEAGKEASGLEVSAAALEVIPTGLRERVAIGDFSTARGSYDLACCVEVAEHIEPERSEELVDSLARLAEKWIYFTAAPPGQSGRGHINCREAEEWLSWFGDCGWQLAEERTASLRERLQSLAETPWLATNSLVLQPEGS